MRIKVDLGAHHRASDFNVFAGIPCCTHLATRTGEACSDDDDARHGWRATQRPAQRSEPVRHGSHGRFQRPRQSFPLATRICEACPGAQGCAPTIRPAQRSEQVRQGCRRCARDRSGNPGAITKGAARRLLLSRGVVAESPTRRSRGAPFPLFISLRNSLSCRGCRRTARPCARAPAPWCRGRGR